MKNHLISLVVGVLGVFLALMSWHIYNDHKLIDQIRFDIIRNQQKTQESK